MENNNQTIKYVIAIIIVAVIGFIAFKLVVNNDMGPVDTGENPAPVVHDDWKTSSVAGVSFQYPETFGAKYMREQDWPPVLNRTADQFSCSNAGAETERAGESETKTINGHLYCVTKVSEGAAGSTYTQYAYARVSEEGMEVMTFTLKAVQCGNYEELEKNECEAERATFDIDKLVDEIFQTVTK